jgi:hypothetical protein
MLALSVILGSLNVHMESIKKLDVVNRNHMAMVMVIMRTLVTLSVIPLRLNVPMALTIINALVFQINQKTILQGPHQ